METITEWLSIPLGYVMLFCYNFISNYGVAIIVFTLITKIILIPVSVWVQNNSIKMVKMQPEINRIKTRFFGDPDTIAEQQSKLHKANKYNPLASLVPLAIQIILLMGIVGVIYHPFESLFHIPTNVISAINNIASQITGISTDTSSIQLYAVDAIKNPEYYQNFLALGDKFPNIAEYLEQIKAFDLQFLGMNLSWNPSEMLGITIIVPVIAGFSAWLLCVAQNKSNVLQAEQSKLNKYSMMILSVGLSLYLGFFVPAGIALYWVASNIFAIITLYALNAVIPPKKYVDYVALDESRKELAALEGLEKKTGLLFNKDPNKKREKADYKRFFQIANKHVVFYSEKSGFYKYYKDIIEYLLSKTNLKVHYVTNDPNDKIFELAKDESRIKPYYIGVKKLITLMMRMDADIVLMTTPDIDNYYIKRSLMRKDVKYIFVPHDSASMHMGFREHSLDNFDTVFCSGPHIVEEVRASEKFYNTSAKTLVKFGYPLIEDLIESYEKMDKVERQRKQILIGPSWQEDNLLDSCVDKLIESLYCDDYHIIVRPHPEYMKRYSPKMDLLIEKYKDKIGEGLTFETDFTTNVSTYSSDLLITDWSAIGLEFCFATLKPAMFINTKMKVENKNYQKIGIEPQDIKLRDILGISLNKDQLDKVSETARSLINDKTYKDRIEKIRNEYFFNLGSHGSNGGKYIVEQLINNKKRGEN